MPARGNGSRGGALRIAWLCGARLLYACVYSSFVIREKVCYMSVCVYVCMNVFVYACVCVSA